MRDRREIKGAPQVLRDLLRAPERLGHHVAELDLPKPSARSHPLAAFTQAKARNPRHGAPAGGFSRVSL
jgi:hypothetical protein